MKIANDQKSIAFNSNLTTYMMDVTFCIFGLQRQPTRNLVEKVRMAHLSSPDLRIGDLY